MTRRRRRRLVLPGPVGFILVALLLITLLIVVSRSGPPPVVVPPTLNPACHADPKEHVYHPDRLLLIDPCKTITGTVRVIRSEADGDYHILVELDAPYASLVNQSNVTYQMGYLVVEPVCEHTVTQADAISTCVGVAPSVPLPKIGQHVTVTGPYVLDVDHFSWAEIHPAWEIR